MTRQANKGSFKKGMTPWNKGLKGCLQKNITSFKKGHKPWNTGRTNPYMVGNQLSKGRIPWNKGQKPKYLQKENHPNWIADRNRLVRSEKKHLDGKYREWMFAVKNRDGWKCRISNGDCNGRLESHHILNWKEYPELRYDIRNGITLCHAHHPRGRDKESKLSPYFQKLVAEMN